MKKIFIVLVIALLMTGCNTYVYTPYGIYAKRVPYGTITTEKVDNIISSRGQGTCYDKMIVTNRGTIIRGWYCEYEMDSYPLNDIAHVRVEDVLKIQHNDVPEILENLTAADESKQAK